MPKTKKSESKKSSKDKSPKPSESRESKRKKPASRKKSGAAPAPATLPKSVSKAKMTVAADKSHATPVISLEAISLRAYFIAERRHAMGWAGDSASDWLEAERQIKAEAAAKAKQNKAPTRRIGIL